MTSTSRRGDEHLSLCHDVLSDALDRDYRSACVIFSDDSASRNIRSAVFHIIAAHANEPRLRSDASDAECFRRENGIAVDLLSIE